MNKYQCIFCGETINKENVTSLLVTANWENEEEQSDQQVFCHMHCLKDKCYISDSIYIDED